MNKKSDQYLSEEFITVAQHSINLRIWWRILSGTLDDNYIGAINYINMLINYG